MECFFFLYCNKLPFNIPHLLDEINFLKLFPHLGYKASIAFVKKNYPWKKSDSHRMQSCTHGGHTQQENRESQPNLTSRLVKSRTQLKSSNVQQENSTA